MTEDNKKFLTVLLKKITVSAADPDAAYVIQMSKEILAELEQ